jgi:hypothetical protein
MRSQFGSHRKKWRTVATADLREWPPWQNTPLLRWEAETWRQYQLALMLPMHFPEFTDDRDISATLAHVAKNERLPWEFSEHEWSELCRTLP